MKFVTHRAPDVSITAHTGFVNAFLTVVGRGRYDLPTGGAYPQPDVYPSLIATRRCGSYRRQAQCILEWAHLLPQTFTKKGVLAS